MVFVDKILVCSLGSSLSSLIYIAYICINCKHIRNNNYFVKQEYRVFVSFFKLLLYDVKKYTLYLKVCRSVSISGQRVRSVTFCTYD